MGADSIGVAIWIVVAGNITVIHHWIATVIGGGNPTVGIGSIQTPILLRSNDISKGVVEWKAGNILVIVAVVGGGIIGIVGIIIHIIHRHIHLVVATNTIIIQLRTGIGVNTTPTPTIRGIRIE